MNWMKLAFWGSEHYSVRTMYLLGAACIACAPLMLWIGIEKEEKFWPEETALDVAVGKVDSVVEGDRKIAFRLGENCRKFVWRPLYGSTWSQIESTLRAPDGLIAVKFIEEERPAEKRECGTFNIYALARNGLPVLTYEQSMESFKADAAWLPWVFGLFLLGGPYILLAARFKQQGKID